jgi:hypothetical protein
MILFKSFSEETFLPESTTWSLVLIVTFKYVDHYKVGVRFRDHDLSLVYLFGSVLICVVIVFILL